MSSSHILDALAAPARRAILETLCTGPHAAGELARSAGISQSAASQHLQQLMRAGLAEVSRDGRQRVYRALPAGLAQLQDYVSRLQMTLAGVCPAGDDASLDAIDHAAAAYNRTWPAQDPAAYAIPIRLLLLAGHVRQGLESTAARLALGGGELIVIEALMRQGPPYACTPTQLQQQMSVTLGGLSRRIDRLQARGMVDRLVDPHDARATLVRLTDTARIQFEALMHQGRHSSSHLALIRMDVAQRTLLSVLLKQLLRLMQSAEEEANDAPKTEST